jgi:hypothetical protein
MAEYLNGKRKWTTEQTPLAFAFAPFVLSPPLLAPVAPAAHRQRVRGMARLVLRAVDHDPVGSPVSTTTSPFTLAFAHLQIVFQRAERRRGDARWQGARGHEPSLEGTPSRPKERRTLPAPRPADAAGELLFSTPPLVAPILFRLTAHRRRRAFSPGHLNEHAVSSSEVPSAADQWRLNLASMGSNEATYGL